MTLSRRQAVQVALAGVAAAPAIAAPRFAAGIEGQDNRPRSRQIEIRREVQRVVLGGVLLTLHIVDDFTAGQLLRGRGSADDHRQEGAHSAPFHHVERLWALIASEARLSKTAKAVTAVPVRLGTDPSPEREPT